MPVISADLVEKLANLVRLPLSPQRRSVIAPAFGQLLDDLNKLDEVDLGPTEPAVIFQQVRGTKGGVEKR